MTQHSCGNPKPNRHPHLHSVLPEPGPQHSAGHSDARRVECVSFNYRVTVYPADDYDRKGTWMHAADDRMKFRRRIEQTELIFAPVLNEKYLRHRDRAINEHCREWIFFIIDSYKVPSVGSVDIIACVSVFFAVETLVCLVFFDLLYQRYWTYGVVVGAWGVV